MVVIQVNEGVLIMIRGRRTVQEIGLSRPVANNDKTWT